MVLCGGGSADDVPRRASSEASVRVRTDDGCKDSARKQGEAELADVSEFDVNGTKLAGAMALKVYDVELTMESALGIAVISTGLVATVSGSGSSKGSFQGRALSQEMQENTGGDTVRRWTLG